MNKFNILNPMSWLGLDWAGPGFIESGTAFKEAVGTTIDPDEDQWRPLSSDGRRDLLPVTHRRMQDLAVYLWQQNPIANRLIELPVAYMLADGCHLVSTAQDEDLRGIVQEWLDQLWHHPINNFPLRLPDRLRELAVFGEQCWPAFVSPTGAVRYGYLDPSLIETVVTDPDNSQQPIGVITVRDTRGRQKRYRVIANGPENEMFTSRTIAIRETFTDGDAHYWSINKLASEKRGRSDLLALTDWLDAYETMLFGEVDRMASLRAYIWDVTLTGATADEVRKRATEIGPPVPGSVRVHNDSEAWQAVSPSLELSDGAEGARLIRNHILGGATVPEHWFGGAADVNRATGESMGEPSTKMMSMRQQFLGAMLEECASYTIRQRELATTGREPDLYSDVYRVSAQFPEMVARDTTKFASALQQVVVAAGLALDRGIISEATALSLISTMSGQLGVTIDAETELSAARADASRREAADAFPSPIDAP